MKSLENIFIIGDVHGCYHTLMKLVAQLPQGAKLIFVGDLCDRGYYTKEVIEFIIQNNHASILGNHDFYMIEHMLECMAGAKVRWNEESYMGGHATLASYGGDYELVHRHLAFLKSLPQYIKLDRYFITHAFCMPYYKRRDDASKSHAMMVNRPSDEAKWCWDWEEGWREYEVLNIFGHDSKDEVVAGENFIGIDTGCVYGGRLTALQLHEMRFFHQEHDPKDILF